MLLCAEHVLPITAEPIDKGAVLVKDNKIADIGPVASMLIRYPNEEVRDFGQAAILPGFVNVHTHLEYTAMRGIVHDVPYATWLLLVNNAATKMTPQDLEASALMGGLEGIASGTTCMADITPTGWALSALQDLGLRGVIYREVGAKDRQRVNYAMNLAKSDIARWQDLVDADRIAVGIAPAALYACHPSIFQSIAEYAGDEVPVAMHLAGSMEEYKFIRNGTSAFSVDALADARGYVEIPPWLPTGATPVNYALNWDAFEVGNMLAIHCVHVSDDDITKLYEHDVAIGVCPRCNAQLGMGNPPLEEYLRLGMRVGLGTDSPAAIDSTDMFLEMHTGMLVQRSLNSNYFLTAQTMLEMATIGGARALRMDDRIGSLEVGKLADVIAVDMSTSHQTPTTEPYSALVNTVNASNIMMTMVDGKILYENDKWCVNMDVDRVKAQVIAARERMRG
ncbi:MAG: amidohydrolase family protein [Eggerthellaceae bacterium]|nr:amidohydrolase family protein [Eggerthellaceae bacterium]